MTLQNSCVASAAREASLRWSPRFGCVFVAAKIGDAHRQIICRKAAGVERRMIVVVTDVAQKNRFGSGLE
jgi:hypothetical protein